MPLRPISVSHSHNSPKDTRPRHTARRPAPQDAWVLCSTTAWDIVLADLRLPGLSGTDLAKAYWQHIGGRSTTALTVSERVARQAQTIFIACSADAGSIDLASCGMHDALCKRAIAPCGRSAPRAASADGPRVM